MDGHRSHGFERDESVAAFMVGRQLEVLGRAALPRGRARVRRSKSRGPSVSLPAPIERADAQTDSQLVGSVRSRYMTADLRSAPIRILSEAYSRSVIETAFLSSDDALSAATLTRLERSAPEKPLVAPAHGWRRRHVEAGKVRVGLV